MNKSFKIPEPLPVKVGDKELTFHFNNYALLILSELLACDPLTCHKAIMDLGSKDILRATAYLLYAGVVGFEKSEGNYNHGLDIKDFSKYLASCDFSEFNDPWKVYMDCSGISDFLASLPKPEDDKKKVKSAGKKRSNTRSVTSA